MRDTLIFELIQLIRSKAKVSQEEAWIFLEKVTNLSKTQLLANGNISLTKKQIKLLNSYLDKIINEHMPIQYIVGNVPFIDLEILVEPPILIPRPETEFWVYELIKKLLTLKNQAINILDLCTGSGCIALAIANALPNAKVIAIDINDQSIKLGKKNAKHNKIQNVQFIKSDLFENLKNKKFDLIVANPPYIAPKYYKSLDDSVKNWEDKSALIAKQNGLFLIKKIIDDAKEFLLINSEFMQNNIANIWIEIDAHQAELVSEYFEKMGFGNINVLKDQSNRDRVVSAFLE